MSEQFTITIYGTSRDADSVHPHGPRAVAWRTLQHLLDLGHQVDAAEFRITNPAGGPEPIAEEVPTVEEHLALISEAAVSALSAESPDGLEFVEGIVGCMECDGTGVVKAATGALKPPEGFVFVERCACGKYPDDLAAAQAWGVDAQWHRREGGYAMARPRSEVSV